MPTKEPQQELGQVAEKVRCGVSHVWHINSWCTAEEEAALIAAANSARPHEWSHVDGRRLLHRERLRPPRGRRPVVLVGHDHACAWRGRVRRAA